MARKKNNFETIKYLLFIVFFSKITANTILFRSSIECGLLHLVNIMTYDQCPFYYRGFLLVGVLCSLLNHGMTSEMLKLLDRVVMSTGVGITLWRLASITDSPVWWKIVTHGGLVTALGFFGWSKVTKNVKYHKVSHYVITLTNCSILQHALTTCAEGLDG